MAKGAAVNEYFTKQKLQELDQDITDRDRHILKSLQNCRYLTTLQIARLYCGQSINKRAAVRAADRSLTRLRDHNLIRSLQRRIGGVRAGSGSFVWALTPSGFKLLQLRAADNPQRKFFREPTLHFMTHTLVISEAWLQLHEICCKNNMTLARVQFEPDCWRWYTTKGGRKAVLKPDLYAVTQGGGYEDCWFIEIDCDTETIARVMDKCDRFLEYLRTGAEQKQTGVFPNVVWIVPDEKRKNSVLKHLRMQYPHDQNVFLVILPDELEPLITGGAAEYIKRVRVDSG